MTTQDITFRTRTWVTPEALDADGSLFGGSLRRRSGDEGTAATGGRGSRRTPRGKGL